MPASLTTNLVTSLPAIHQKERVREREHMGDQQNPADLLFGAGLTAMDFFLRVSLFFNCSRVQIPRH